MTSNPKQCSRCGLMNAPDWVYCQRCNGALMTSPSGQLAVQAHGTSQAGSESPQVYATPPTEHMFEREIAVLDNYENQVDALVVRFLETEPAGRSRVQGELDRMLKLLWGQIDGFRRTFPAEDAWRLYMCTYYMSHAVMKGSTVGFFRKSSNRTNSRAIGLATGLVARQQEKANLVEALKLLDQACQCWDNARAHMIKVRCFQALGETQHVLGELQYVMQRFPDEPEYVEARQVWDEMHAPAKGMCFIATAAYGSELAPDVVLLRRFRDEELLATRSGRLVVAAYRRMSPPIARLIARHEAMKSLTRRVVLRPVVRAVRRRRARGTVVHDE